MLILCLFSHKLLGCALHASTRYTKTYQPSFAHPMLSQQKLTDCAAALMALHRSPVRVTDLHLTCTATLVPLEMNDLSAELTEYRGDQICRNSLLFAYAMQAAAPGLVAKVGTASKSNAENGMTLAARSQKPTEHYTCCSNHDCHNMALAVVPDCSQSS